MTIILNIILLAICLKFVAGRVRRVLSRSSISRSLDKAERMLEKIEAEQAIEVPLPILPPPEVRKQTIGERGATPQHYRAFSVAQHRLMTTPHANEMYGFRQTAKSIKTYENAAVREEALAVMTTFAKLVDAYAPLWDSADPDPSKRERTVLEAEFTATMIGLHESLKACLVRPESREAFDTVNRYVEIRYGGDESDYGLKAIA